MKNLFKYLSISVTLFPGAVFADYLGGTQQFVGRAEDIIEFMLIPLAFSVALLFFFWGVAKYIRSVGTDKEEGRQIMVWGIIALFVMSAVWGLVRFIREEFNISNESSVKVPTIQP